MRADPDQVAAIPAWGVYLGGWPDKAVATAGVRNATNAVEGSQTLFITEYLGGSWGTPSAVFQDVGELKPNTTYVLKVAAGGPLSGFGDGCAARIALVNGSHGEGSDRWVQTNKVAAGAAFYRLRKL